MQATGPAARNGVGNDPSLHSEGAGSPSVRSADGMTQVPGGRLATRPLHFFWLADCSGSMAADGKMEALNNAIREALPHLNDVAEENPYASLLVRAIAFSTGVRWHIEQPTPVADLHWRDLEAGGFTDLGAALTELATQLRVPPMEQRALPPAIVLISDGQPTDDFDVGLEELLATPWGERAIRIGVGIGRDADAEMLKRFIGDNELEPITANDPEQLVQMIRWASTVATRMASVPTSQRARGPVVPVPRVATAQPDDGEPW